MNWLDDFTVKFTYSDNTTQTITSANYLTSINFSNQLNSAASDYDAAPISNMLLIGFDYDSCFWNKIYKGMKCELFNGLERLGVFYLTDFNPPEEDDAIATITAYDFFYNLINREVIPTFEIVDDMGVRSYITAVFNSVGISSDRLVIDESISDSLLNYSVCDGANLSTILTEFMLATDTFIYVDADENIQIVPKTIEVDNEVEYEELDDDVLSALNLGNTFEEAYTGIKLTYNRITIGDIQTLLKTKTTLQPNTTTTISNITLPSPLYILTTIKTDIDTLITSVVSSQNSIDISLLPDISEEQTVNIELIGQFIKFVESFVISEDQSDNPNYLGISSKLIQYTETATTLANTFKNRLNKRVIRVGMMPDDFSVELGKIFKVSSTAKGLDAVYAYVHGYELAIVEGDVELTLTLKEIEEVEDNGNQV